MRTGRVPSGPLRSIVKDRLRPYTIYRPTETVEGWGERKDDYATHSADVYLYDPQRAESQLPTGEATNLDVSGLCLPSSDVEEDDLLEYGGEVVEVVSKTQYPATGSPTLHRLALRDRDDATLP